MSPVCDITHASDDLAQLAILLRWAGTAVTDCLSPNSVAMSEVGSAMRWAGQMIEERCAIISEAASGIDVDSPVTIKKRGAP
ncbi:hypothetical protein HLH29_18365 [Gluconacetobacter tumulicola]|uniref:Uncharacterized protein n=1 Tax=Gluconacetobacter tumulicola TaxID=1017177 RepID=A0A7W4JGZ7_9PROT|nr:hypothetical protein [Gluconacetobacter tumulicola]